MSIAHHTFENGDSGHYKKSKKDNDSAKKKKSSVEAVSAVTTASPDPVALPSDVAVVNAAYALTDATIERITKAATDQGSD